MKIAVLKQSVHDLANSGYGHLLPEIDEMCFVESEFGDAAKKGWCRLIDTYGNDYQVYSSQLLFFEVDDLDLKQEEKEMFAMLGYRWEGLDEIKRQMIKKGKYPKL